MDLLLELERQYTMDRDPYILSQINRLRVRLGLPYAFDEDYDNYESAGNPVPSNFKDLPKAKQKSILSEHEEQLEDWLFFNNMNPDNPPYSEDRIKGYEKDIARIRQIFSGFAPIPESSEYRELPEYRWQEEVLKLIDLIKTSEEQIDNIRYYERNIQEVRRMTIVKQELKSRNDYFLRQIERVGEIRELLDEVNEELSSDQPQRDIGSLQEAASIYRSDIDIIVRETNRKL